MTAFENSLHWADDCLRQDLSTAIASLSAGRVIPRIWERDSSVWGAHSDAAARSLGWLEVPKSMLEIKHNLFRFAEEINDSFFKHIVVLGMVGSSLGPLVISKILRPFDDFPLLMVLDSTLPQAITDLEQSIDVSRTLFIVSSKSGETIEPYALYRRFRSLVSHKVGELEAGSHFVAITDPQTQLGKLGLAENFRKIFENTPDIGGRYSVLSLFGLVPAVLHGADVELLLERAINLLARTRPEIATEQNPSAELGAFIATMSLHNRDKVTLLTSPHIKELGLWIEQLLAESLGKGTCSLTPVVGEPAIEANAYGEDRCFVYMRVRDDENAESDVRCERLRALGFPVFQIELGDVYDLGAEFYRWEFATCVAGALLRINPFDQPHVQSTKDLTGRLLNNPGMLGTSVISDGADVPGFLERISSGDYLGILAYLPQTEGVDAALHELRRRIVERYKIATTVGYGPRYLHSTGQLHKGGRESGWFLMLTSEDNTLDIPDERYGFKELATAQALGDYQALSYRGRPILRIHLRTDIESGLLRLVASIDIEK